jgi:hypothetical protein
MNTSYARKNQYIFVAQSVWWLAPIIRLQGGLIKYIDNLRKWANIEIHTKPITSEIIQIDYIAFTPCNEADTSDIHPNGWWREYNTESSLSGIDG